LKIEGVNEGVKKELIELLAYLEKNPLKKTPEIAQQINKSVSTAERYLKLLKDRGLIEFAGAPKSGGYQIIKQE